MANFNKIPRFTAVGQTPDPFPGSRPKVKNMMYQCAQSSGEPCSTAARQPAEEKHSVAPPPVLGNESGYLGSPAPVATAPGPGSRQRGTPNSYDHQWDNTYKNGGAKAAATAIFEQIAAEERTNNGSERTHEELVGSVEKSNEYFSEVWDAEPHPRAVLSSTEQYMCRKYFVSSLPTLEAYEVRETRKVSPRRGPAFSATVSYAARRAPSPKSTVSGDEKFSEGKLRKADVGSVTTPEESEKPDLHATEECPSSNTRQQQLCPRSPRSEEVQRNTRQSVAVQTGAPVAVAEPLPPPHKLTFDASTMTSDIPREVTAPPGHSHNFVTLHSAPYESEYFGAGRGGPKSTANESIVSLSTVSNSTLNQRPDPAAFGGFRNFNGYHPHCVNPKYRHTTTTHASTPCTKPPLTPRLHDMRSAPALPSCSSWDSSPSSIVEKAVPRAHPQGNVTAKPPKCSSVPPEVWAAKLRQLDNAYVTSSDGWAILHEIRLILEGRHTR